MSKGPRQDQVCHQGLIPRPLAMPGRWSLWLGLVFFLCVLFIKWTCPLVSLVIKTLTPWWQSYAISKQSISSQWDLDLDSPLLSLGGHKHSSLNKECAGYQLWSLAQTLSQWSWNSTDHFCCACFFPPRLCLYGALDGDPKLEDEGQFFMRCQFLLWSAPSNNGVSPAIAVAISSL